MRLVRATRVVMGAGLLLALVAAACAPVPEVGPGGLDLLLLSPVVDDPGEIQLARVKTKRWSFTDGLPREWHPGPAEVTVERRPDGLRLGGPRPPFLEIRIGTDPLRYEKMIVVLEEGQGESAELFYSYEKPAVYRLAGRVESTPEKRASPHERAFLLPHPDGAEKRMEAFRLYPGGRKNGAVTVKEIRLVPRRSGFFQEAILSRDRIDLNQEYRRCWRISGEGERTVKFRVPASGAVLSFGTGTLLGGGETRLRLTAEAPGHDEAELLALPFGRRDDGWRDHRVDLTGWAGTTLTLRFNVESNGRSGAIRLIGSPVVRPVDGPDRPNVILLVVDTLRADRLSAYGRPERLSPHLDRLARQGLLFTGARAPSSWTLPSTASLLTGSYSLVPGVEKGAVPAVPADAVTLAESFSSRGYATAGFSANFVLDGFRGFARGFDTWYLAPYRDAHRPAADLNRRALEWVRHQGDGPFLLYLQYMDPHEPYDAPDPGRPFGRPGPFSIERGHRWQDGTIVPLIMDWEHLDGPGDRQRLEGFYHEEVAYVDYCLGRLLASLRAAGLLDNTLVLVTADHGEELGDHGHWSHGYTLHQEVLHVPLILSGAGLGQRRGAVEHAPVSLLDVAPTLTALAGFGPVARPGDGHFLLEPPSGRTFFAATAACGLPVRYSAFDGRYAYIRFDRSAADDLPAGTRGASWLAHADPPAEALYDLHADPLERENLALRLPEVVSRLSTGLEAQFPHAGEGADSAPLDDADLERLRALGYIQ